MIALSNGVKATIARKAPSKGGPAGPTTTFSEFDTEITVEAENASQSHRLTKFDIRAIEAPGYQNGLSIYRNATGFNLAPGQRGTMTLRMGQTLSPGRFRLVVTAGGVERSVPITVTTEFPLAEILDAEREAELGPNVALAALGGRASTSSSWDNLDIANQLIDGVPWVRNPENTRKCMKCGWASRVGDNRPTAMVDLAGDRAVAISSVVLDVRKFKPEWTNWNPKTVRISVSETGNSADLRPVTTARLSKVRERQLIALPQSVMARTVKFEFLSNFDREPGAGINEIEVREAPDADPSLLGELERDIARPELGGAVVRYRGYGERWTAARMFDGLPTSWGSSDDYFPQDFTIAFNRDRRADIDRIELVMDDEEQYSDQWPSEVAVALSDHPIEGFEEVVRVKLQRRSGVFEIPINETARFVKVRLLDNHGASITNLGEIRVIEASGVLSVLASDVTREAAGSRTDGHGEIVADLQESEPNNSPAEANNLAFNQTTSGRIDPLGEEDFFALPEFDKGATALTLSYSGRPNIRHGLSLLNEAGEVLSHFDPGDLPAADARLSFKLSGFESHLKLTEPQASVVVIWDTSGSMQGNEGDLERAVRQYVQLAPDLQEIALIRFSDRVQELGGFSADKSELAERLNGQFRPNGGTSLYDAVLRALDMLEGRTGNRAIVLMTDGNDNSRTWLGDVWTELERNRVRLYTIGLGDGLQEYSYILASTGERLLGHLAMATNGRSFFATESSALRSFYDEIAREMSSPAVYLLRPQLEKGMGKLRLVTTGEELPGAALPRVHVIFDVSGSMSERLQDGRRRIDAAKEAMYAALDGLPEGAPFGLTVYGARIPEKPDKERACQDILTVQATGPLQKERVVRFIKDLRPRGGTTPLAASIGTVFEGMKQGQGRTDGGIIIAITDGIEECDPNPVVTVESLAAAGINLELNLIGFDLRQEATRDMMRRLAEVGGGRYYDAGDGPAVAKALRTAMAASFVVSDAAGNEVAKGRIGGTPVEVPPGSYDVSVRAADGPIVTRSVEIEDAKLTTISVNKTGSEIGIEVGDPKEHDPMVACGEAALARGETERLRRIQALLGDLGYEPGPADNFWGSRTEQAIVAFLKDHALDIAPEPTLRLEQHLDCFLSINAPLRTTASGEEEASR
ncbi:VWA domain-containing protein [Roseibium sp. HPY-6]|uniref:VWA domain-containing protein n=1 Tax=Roseibium sp. HPY-6 TaxID=3229852 RepID=UPI00338E0B86